MTNQTLRVLTGIWYDEAGYQTEQGADFPVFVAADGAIEDDMHIVWTVDDKGDLVSDQCTAYFSPDKGELARIGLT